MMSLHTGAADELLRQREIIAQFGEFALRSNSLDEILAEACRLVRDALNTDLAKVMELQNGDASLFVKAGIGWKPGVVGHVKIKMEKTSSEGHALATDQPVISNDIAQETRFQYAGFILDNGVQALVNVPIRRPNGRHYGILQVDSRTPRKFDDVTIGFLRGYVNLIGAAIDRLSQAEVLKLAQEALLESETVRRQTQKLEAIGQLTGGVAHDFNNLLTIMRSAVDFLRRDGLPEARRTRYVEVISDTVGRATTLTGQLLAFARRQPLVPAVFDVGAHVTKMADLLRPSLGGLMPIKQNQCDPPCFAEADISQFETALVNLAVNARDAMKGEGPLHVDVRQVAHMPAIRGHQSSPGPFIAVSVRDSGPGIDPAHIDRIFEPFFTTKEIGAGSGLGLSQVIGFAKQSGGQVEVQSQLGEGATFTLYLPHHSPPALTSQRTEKRPTTPADGAHVLVVEDNDTIGQLTTEMLLDLGYQPTWVPNAAAALAMLSQDNRLFHLVFTDVVMPGMNGIDFARTIKDLYPALPVVLTSGYSHVLAADGSHGFDLIQKPYSVEDVSRVLRKVVTPNN
jgi:signal transduction histidine kinase